MTFGKQTVNLPSNA